jgi:hypothetical protein
MHCRHCHERLPLSARSCFACGAPVMPPPADAVPPAPVFPHRGRIGRPTPMRDRPFASARQIVLLPAGLSVAVLAEQWDFLQVETDDRRRGFVERAAVELVDAAPEAASAPSVDDPPRRHGGAQPADRAPAGRPPSEPTSSASPAADAGRHRAARRRGRDTASTPRPAPARVREADPPTAGRDSAHGHPSPTAAPRRRGGARREGGATTATPAPPVPPTPARGPRADRAAATATRHPPRADVPSAAPPPAAPDPAPAPETSAGGRFAATPHPQPSAGLPRAADHPAAASPGPPPPLQAAVPAVLEPPVQGAAAPDAVGAPPVSDADPEAPRSRRVTAAAAGPDELPFGIPFLDGEHVRYRAVFLYNPLEDQALVVTNRRLIVCGGTLGGLPKVLHLDEIEAVRLQDSGTGSTNGEGNLYIVVTGMSGVLHVGGVYMAHLVRNEILAACTELQRTPRHAAAGRRRSPAP